MRKYIVILLLLFVKLSVSQETPVIDSLKKLIAKAPNDTNKVNLYYELYRQYPLFKSNENVQNLLLALNLSKQLNHIEGSKRHYFWVIKTLYYKSMYDVSLNYCFEFIDYCDKNNIPEAKASIYTLMANLLSEEGKFEDAKKYYYLSQEYNKTKNNSYELAGAYTGLAILFTKTNELDSAIINWNHARQIQKSSNLQSGYANSTLGLAEIFLKKKDYTKSINYVNEALDLYLSIPEFHGVTYCYQVLADIQFANNNIDESLKTYSRTLALSDSLNLLGVKRDCSKRLSKIYADKKQFEEAYNYNKIWQSINDSLSFDKQKGKMLEAEVKYDLAKTENTLKEKEFEVLTKNREKKYLYSILLGLGVLLFLSYRAYKLKKNSSEIIAKQKELVEDKQKEILDSINYAKRLQNAILASENNLNAVFKESFILYRPKDIVSGDFYWILHIEDKAIHKNIFAFAAADCTGHGVPGAFMSMLNSTLLNQTIYNPDINTPADALNFLNKELPKNLGSSNNSENINDGMDIAFCVIDLNKNILKYSGANNPCWIIRDNVLIELKPTKQAITASLEYEKKVFVDEELPLQKGDSIYVFTDGYPDQFGGPKGKKFKYKTLSTLLLSINNESMEKQKQILEKTFEEWKGDLDQVDDVCVIGITV